MKKYLLILLVTFLSGIASAQMVTSSFQGSNFLTKNLNNALDFDGVNDHVMTNLDVNYFVMPITTWEAWVYPAASDGSWRTIFGIEDGGWDRNAFINGGYFWAGYGNSGWQITPVNMNEWQHVAVVYNEASGSMKFYKNGVLFTNPNSIGIASSAVKFAIGSSQQAGPNQFFQGRISEVRVWNYERTQAQIQGSMNTELTGEETGLVAYYPFKQGNPNQANTVTTLFDEVGTNNGTITNFALSGTISNFTFGKIESRIPRNNLVMHVNPAWRRSYSGSGTVLNDLTSNGNNMNLLNSPTYAIDYGGSLYLNGTNQRLRTVNNAPIAGTNKRTVGLWMRPTSFNGNGITSIISTGGTDYNSGMFGVYANGTNKLSFWGHNSDFISGINVPLENWSFVATTYDGVGNLKLHVNGVTESIGRTINTMSNQMDVLLSTTGTFGEMMIYDRDLSASDLAYIYNRTKSKYPPPPDGLTAATAATSAKAIKAAYPSFTDGVYYINLPTVGVKAVYCLMDSKYDGGGWMMAMKATTGATFNYDANYWYTANTLNPAETNRNDGDAKFDVFNYYGSSDLLALWPDISNVGAESGSIDNLTNWSWLQTNINSGVATTLINKFALSPTQQTFYTNTNGTMTFSGFGTKFSNQGGFTFYGFNYLGNTNDKVRWGFAWNNETDQGSNDVRGGIGLKAVNYSAGDHIGCCQVQMGINRSARVEMYVR